MGREKSFKFFILWRVHTLIGMTPAIIVLHDIYGNSFLKA